MTSTERDTNELEHATALAKDQLGAARSAARAAKWAAGAAVAATVAAIAQVVIAYFSMQIAYSADVRQTMLTYLTEYKEQTSDEHKHKILAEIPAYEAANDEERIRVQILDSLLVAVLDAMNYA